MTKEKWTFDRIRERQPNFDRINAALDEFAAGQPVTQRTINTNEPIFVTDNMQLGVTYVTAGKRVLARFKFPPNYDLPREQARRVSTFHDPETGETTVPRQPERRGSGKPPPDRDKDG